MPKSMSMSAPDLEEPDLQAVLEVVRSGRLALGPKADEFERVMAKYVGRQYGVAVSSGTAALHLIIKSLGIGRGDEVLVPSFTFAASVNVILYEGGIPVFVDIEADTYNLSPKDVARKITKRTKAIMAVDVFGHPVEWDEIMSIASTHGLKVIDDSCEALGAEYKGKKVGAFGDAAAFAFYPNKQITTGEGGMVVTDDEDMARLTRSLRNQGRGENATSYQHERVGYNYRLTEMSAALGISQMKRLDTILSKRDRVARNYTRRLDKFSWLDVPRVRPHVKMSWLTYVVTLAEGLDRNGIMAGMEVRGIPTRAYFAPLHLQRYVEELLGRRRGELPVTESVARRTLALPFHNNLTEEDVERVVQVFQEVVEESGVEK